jgi:adenylate cyclase
LVDDESISPFLDVSGPAGEHRLSLASYPVVEIGRGQSSALSLVSQSVSRRHALIRKRADGSVCIIDLGSRNGTEVNGRRIDTEEELNDGDRVQIGEYTIVFRCPASGPRATFDGEATRLVVNHRPVTVLVMDLHGYTALSRMLDGNTVSGLLGAFGSRAESILESRGVWHHKMIGDAVMAVWAHPSLAAVRDQIRPPLLAACEVSSMVQRLGQEFRLKQELRVGAGLSTGEASIGGLGAAGKVEVLGDTVNLAFRLEAATRQLGDDFLICEATRYVLSAAPQDLFLERRAELKGFSQPVCAFGVSIPGLRQWLG